MKKIVGVIFFTIVGILNVYSQQDQVSCAQAVNQLNWYATQVNNYYQTEYWNTIPNVRCPSFDIYGRPYHPQAVQNCRLQTLALLNQWYNQQCTYVNNWYGQIISGCSSEPNPIHGPAPDPVRDENENSGIDTEVITDLIAGIDQNKALKITIPTTAAGFRPNN